MRQGSISAFCRLSIPFSLFPAPDRTPAGIDFLLFPDFRSPLHCFRPRTDSQRGSISCSFPISDPLYTVFSPGQTANGDRFPALFRFPIPLALFPVLMRKADVSKNAQRSCEFLRAGAVQVIVVTEIPILIAGDLLINGDPLIFFFDRSQKISITFPELPGNQL